MSQYELPCIGGPLNGMRYAIRPSDEDGYLNICYLQGLPTVHQYDFQMSQMQSSLIVERYRLHTIDNGLRILFHQDITLKAALLMLIDKYPKKRVQKHPSYRKARK